MSVNPVEFLSARDRLGVERHQQYAEATGTRFEINGGRVPTVQEANKGGTADDSDDGFFGPDGLTFGDFIDLINPLQHLPIVSTLYREITGDEISHGARIFGGALYGGPLGLISSIANAAVVDASGGKDIGQLAFSVIGGGESEPPAEMVAEAPAAARIDPTTAAAIGAAATSVAATSAATKPSAADLAPATAPGAPRASATLEPPPTPPPAPEATPELTDAQAARLLSALGIEDVSPAAEPVDTLAPAAGARSAADAQPVAGGILPVSPANAPYGAIPATTAGAEAPHWVVRAMEHGIDKYHASLAHRAATGEKRVDTDL